MSIWLNREAMAAEKANAPLYHRRDLEPLIPKLIEFAKEYNQRPAADYTISYMFTFGSFEAGAEECHDLDVAVALEPKWFGDKSQKKDVYSGPTFNMSEVCKEIHSRISPAIELHLLDDHHFTLVNMALMMGPAADTILKADENQSYVFSGPHSMIFSASSNTPALHVHMCPLLSVSNNFFSGVAVARILGFLSCFFFDGGLERDEEGYVNVLTPTTCCRIAGTDLNMFGVEDETVLQAIINNIRENLPEFFPPNPTDRLFPR